MLDKLAEWMSKHSDEITEVQEILNKRLEDDPVMLREQMLDVEARFSRHGKLLADLNKLYVDTKEDIGEKKENAEAKRIRDIVAAQMEHIETRISVCQSLLRYHVTEMRNLNYGGK
jgi:hypothetical protein